jgi:hypothetical protein
MNTTALPLSRIRLASWPNLAARLSHFIMLTKPRMMALAVGAVAHSRHRDVAGRQW